MKAIEMNALSECRTLTAECMSLGCDYTNPQSLCMHIQQALDS
jgi:hypothetical protein